MTSAVRGLPGPARRRGPGRQLQTTRIRARSQSATAPQRERRSTLDFAPNACRAMMVPFSRAPDSTLCGPRLSDVVSAAERTGADGTHPEVQVQVTEERELASDGNTMTVTTTMLAPRGTTTGKLVFVKQAQ